MRGTGAVRGSGNTRTSTNHVKRRRMITWLLLIFYITSVNGDGTNQIVPYPEENSVLRPPFQWIHPQKTGSSFGNALFALTCPEQVRDLKASSDQDKYLEAISIRPHLGISGIQKSCRLKWHMTKFEKLLGRKTSPKWIIGGHYTWSENVQQSSTFVTLRSPTRRIKSLVEWRFGSCNGKAFHEMMRRRRKGPWNSYLDYLAGVSKKRTESRVSLVHRRLSKVAWIGLTDYYNASLCLLHSMYPHTSHPLEDVNMRKTVYKSKNGTKHMCSPLSLERKFGSSHRYDIEIYIYAVKVFSQMIMKYGPTCATKISNISAFEPKKAREILENLRGT